MDILIKNARIIDSTQDFYGDVYIKDGKINEIGNRLIKDCITIMADNLTLMPSFIDLHAHFRDPGITYKEDITTGCEAAAHGGYTAVNLMANTKPVCSSMDIVNYVVKKAEDVGLADVHQTVSITNNFDGKTLTHLNELDSSIKFISDDGKGVQDDIVMYKAMLKAKQMGLIIISHAEKDGFLNINNRLSENVMTARDVMLAKCTGCRLHMAHVSTKEAMDEIISSKKSGYNNITCEVMPHNIALDENTNYLVNPPLRKKEDVDFLIHAIKCGFVDCISTDHAPHSAEDKKNGANGISGIETAFSVCFTALVKKGFITLNKLSELMSKNPGAMMGINKGELKAGYDGDAVLVDTNKKYVIDVKNFKSKGKNTPFDGREVYGKVAATFKSGRMIYCDDEYKNKLVH